MRITHSRREGAKKKRKKLWPFTLFNMRHNSRRQRIRLAKEYTRLFISACVGHRKRHIENSQPSSGGERRTRALHTDRRRLKVLTHLAQLGVLLFIDNAVRVRGGGGEGGLRASATTRPVVSADDGSVGIACTRSSWMWNP